MTPSKLGQTQKSNHLFPFLVRIVLLFAFDGWDVFVKNSVTSFHWHHSNNYTPNANKCFNPRNQIVWCSSPAQFRLCTDASCDMRCSHAYATTLRKCWMRYPSIDALSFLFDMLNHTHWRNKSQGSCPRT